MQYILDDFNKVYKCTALSSNSVSRVYKYISQNDRSNIIFSHVFISFEKPIGKYLSFFPIVD